MVAKFAPKTMVQFYFHFFNLFFVFVCLAHNLTDKFIAYTLNNVFSLIKDWNVDF